jgi:hypothetical protein
MLWVRTCAVLFAFTTATAAFAQSVPSRPQAIVPMLPAIQAPALSAGPVTITRLPLPGERPHPYRSRGYSAQCYYSQEPCPR